MKAIEKELLVRKTKEYIDQVKSDYDLIVVKGVSLEELGLERPDLDKILENKREYFLSIVSNNRILGYDEFLSMAESLLPLYRRICILNNNLYINLFPLESQVNEDIKKRLSNHFNPNYENDDYFLGDIEEYLNIFGNYKQINGRDYIVYNDIDYSDKVEQKDIFEKKEVGNHLSQFSLDDKVMEILEEDDYIKLLTNLRPGARINIKKFPIGMEEYEEVINLINLYYSDLIEINIGIYEERDYIEKDYDEYLNILKRYWEKDSFLKIKNYDINRLEQGIKDVKEISQGEIIDSIVGQATKAIEGDNFRDIFMTAPTGSGKSAIFQIPAIYLAEKYEAFTIVISPLIGLMNDQVKGLETRNYSYSRTINSDLSPIKRQEILEDIENGRCHILYISPETLLSRSDVSQLIGDRKIGLFVIDEAHIVTTWGKQFRPDYWFLGDHIKKIRKLQKEKEGGHSFPIATFTATAIYNGIEDMYKETKNSLNLPNPITYLGYVKRDNIEIKIDKSKLITNKTEYEMDKFEKLISQIHRSEILNKKMLIYFPTVALIRRFYDYCIIKDVEKSVTIYHGQLEKQEKDENHQMFLNKEKKVMLATKAFGMGIDIDDIEIVIHFAPTGNVCDYVQEIGRAARRRDLVAEAYYNYMASDFKHINRLHGISMVKEYQLVQVIKKIHELFKQKLREGKDTGVTRKSRSMLIDAESFGYIFENPFFDQDDAINKVKTAMLIIQKDFEAKRGFSPFHMRPIPLFSKGFFSISDEELSELKRKFPDTISLINKDKNIISLNLEKIWESKFNNVMTFPQFKYYLYTQHDKLDFEFKDRLHPALIIDIAYGKNHMGVYSKYKNTLSDIIYDYIREEKFYGVEDIAQELSKRLNTSIYNSRTVAEVFIGAVQIYLKNYNYNMTGRSLIPKPMKDGSIKFRFLNSISQFFQWMDRIFNHIVNNLEDGKLYLVNEKNNTNFKEYLLLLGLVEIMGVLSFKSLGGDSSQIYIYINETKSMESIINKPNRYRNRLLELVNQRHKISVATLSFLFETDLTSDERWDYIEDYFVGIIHDDIAKVYEKKYKEKLDMTRFN